MAKDHKNWKNKNWVGMQIEKYANPNRGFGETERAMEALIKAENGTLEEGMDVGVLGQLLKYAEPSKRFLDLGCNSGDVCKFMKDHGMEVMGVDLPEVVRQIKYKFPKKGMNLEKDFPKGLWDVIYCRETLEHLRNGEDEVLKKIIQALTMDGVAIIACPFSSTDFGASCPEHHRLYKNNELKSCAERQGGVVIKEFRELKCRSAGIVVKKKKTTVSTEGLIKIKPNDVDWLNYIPKPKVFVDIGVGVRDSEAWAIKRKWDDVFVFGIEPHPKRFEKCKAGFPGALHPYAIWHKDKKIEMQNIDGMAVNFPRPHQVNPSKTTAQGRSLDSLHKQFGPWEDVFIWSDTEGAELEMLKGATKLLESGKVIGMVLEAWNAFQSEGWCQYSELVDFLRTYDFEPKYMTRQRKDPWVLSDIIFLPRL